MYIPACGVFFKEKNHLKKSEYHPCLCPPVLRSAAVSLAWGRSHFSVTHSSVPSANRVCGTGLRWGRSSGSSWGPGTLYDFITLSADEQNNLERQTAFYSQLTEARATSAT